VTLKFDDHAVEKIRRSRQVERALLDDGWMIADATAIEAPKHLGFGAASIRAELFHDRLGEPEVRISWDKRHYYMRFPEFGTEYQRAQPFLRLVAARYRR
jgi:HK97 gp10 family phage protein